MVRDHEFNLQKRKHEIENIVVKIKYNNIGKTIDISTPDAFYTIGVKLPHYTPKDIARIEKRTSEVAEFVQTYFIEHPDELHKLGYPLKVAMVNSVGTAVAFNITYVAKGTGDIQIPINNE